MKRTRKDDQVGALSEREVASGYPEVRRERKGLSREVETYIFREAIETAQCDGTDSPSSSGATGPVSVPFTASALRDGGMNGVNRRRLAGVERCEESVAHEHPSTDEHGLLHIEQRECRARDVP